MLGPKKCQRHPYRDTADCEHWGSEDSGVLWQLGEGAGLQGPGHLRA